MMVRAKLKPAATVMRIGRDAPQQENLQRDLSSCSERVPYPEDRKSKVLLQRLRAKLNLLQYIRDRRKQYGYHECLTS